ncbi:MAG: formate--tetrahydrofolate ligase, partial [Bdellovibrionota bacterium]
MSASNIEIAQEAQKSRMRPISEIARKLKIEEEELELFGRFKAKLAWSLLDRVERVPEGKLILVTAMSPTPAGEGKTTTTVGLGDALTALGHRAMICLREPSIGPVFGIKGGAAGGGYSQILPMEDINLHFTGDFHAIQIANNLLAALIDNHLHHGNALGIDVRKVVFKRVLDVSDRSLRQTTIGLGGSANGYPRQDGFDIVVASEVMAILCLATSLKDLRERLGKIVVAQTRDGKPVSAADLMAHGAMAVLLKDALKPNLVQSIEGTPALVHGGPFANIAHGCNSVIATRTALRLADYVVTEAGFGADLGAEKFIDIKCRKSGLKPAACVLVVTVRAIRHHGGPDRSLEVGIADVERHLQNMRDHFGLPIVVAINHFSADAPADLTWIQTRLSA